MSDEPNWVFSSNSGKPTASDIMPRLVEEFPKFRPRWEKHLEFWKGEPAGGYNDMAQFAHFVVEDLYPSGETKQVQLLLT